MVTRHDVDKGLICMDVGQSEITTTCGLVDNWPRVTFLVVHVLLFAVLHQNSCPRLPHSVDSRFGLYHVKFSTRAVLLSFCPIYFVVGGGGGGGEGEATFLGVHLKLCLCSYQYYKPEFSQRRLSTCWVHWKLLDASMLSKDPPPPPPFPIGAVGIVSKMMSLWGQQFHIWTLPVDSAVSKNSLGTHFFSVKMET